MKCFQLLFKNGEAATCSYYNGDEFHKIGAA